MCLMAYISYYTIFYYIIHSILKRATTIEQIYFYVQSGLQSNSLLIRV